MPGGIDCQVSRLSTTTVTRTSSPGSHVRGDVGLERRVAALVLGDLDVVDPDDGAVGGGVEAEDDALPGPAARHPHRPSGTRRRRRGRGRRRRRRCRCSWPAPACRVRRPAAARHQPASRPAPAGSRRNRQSPFRLLRSRVGPSWGRSMAASRSQRGRTGAIGCHLLARLSPWTHRRARHDLRRRPGGRGRAVDGLPGVLPARPGQRRHRRADPAGGRRAGLPHQPAGPGAVDGPHAHDRAGGLRRRPTRSTPRSSAGRRPPRPRPATRSCWPTPRSPTGWSARRWSGVLPTVDGVVLGRHADVGLGHPDDRQAEAGGRAQPGRRRRAVRRHGQRPRRPAAPSSTWPGWGTTRSPTSPGPRRPGPTGCGGGRCGTRPAELELRVRRLGPVLPRRARRRARRRGARRRSRRRRSSPTTTSWRSALIRGLTARGVARARATSASSASTTSTRPNWSRPGLTTVAAPLHVEGATAVEHLLAMVEGARRRTGPPMVLPVRLVGARVDGSAQPEQHLAGLRARRTSRRRRGTPRGRPARGRGSRGSRARTTSSGMPVASVTRTRQRSPCSGSQVPAPRRWVECASTPQCRCRKRSHWPHEVVAAVVADLARSPGAWPRSR